jgi:phage terminase large subunit
MGGRVISEFDRALHVTDTIDVPKNELHEIWVGIDFNVTPVTAVISVKAADQIHVIDEIYLEDSNTHELAQEIRHRYGKHVRVNAYPDPAGRQRKTSAGIGVTDFSILESFGFNVYAPKSTRSVQDGINNVQAAFRTASGHASLFVHPRCKHLILSLERYTYKENSAVPNKANGYDHMVDALRYLVSVERPIMQVVPKFDIRFMVA